MQTAHSAEFAAGKEVGGSVLVLTGRYRPLSVSVYADNAMPAVFGTGQAVATASLNSLLGLGEQLTLSAAGLPDKDFDTHDFPPVAISVAHSTFRSGSTVGILNSAAPTVSPRRTPAWPRSRKVCCRKGTRNFPMRSLSDAILNSRFMASSMRPTKRSTPYCLLHRFR